MNNIDKIASINNINLLYTACRGILRVKQATFADLFPPKPAGRGKKKLPDLTESMDLGSRYNEFKDLYGSNTAFKNFINDTLGRDFNNPTGAFIDDAALQKRLEGFGRKLTYARLADFYDKYSENPLYRPDWLLGREYNGDDYEVEGEHYDKYFKPIFDADATTFGGINGDTDFYSLSDAQRAAFLAKLKGSSTTPVGTRKYRELENFLHYMPNARLKDLAYIYYGDASKGGKGDTKTIRLEGEELGKDISGNPIMGYKPGAKDKDTGEVVHPIVNKDLNLDPRDIASIALDQYDPTRRMSGASTVDMKGLASNYGVNRRGGRGGFMPIDQDNHVDNRRANTFHKHLWSTGLGLGLGAGGYAAGNAVAEGLGLDSNSGVARALRWGGGALGGVGGALLGRYLGNRGRYYE